MQWVVKRNADGSYLVGDTREYESDWKSYNEEELKYKEIYGVVNGTVKPKGTLQRIVDRYKANLKVNGLDRFCQVWVDNVQEAGLKEYICIQPARASESKFEHPREYFKIPNFVDVVVGMSWNCRTLHVPSTVSVIEFTGGEAEEVSTDGYMDTIEIYGKIKHIYRNAFSGCTAKNVIFKVPCEGIEVDKRAFASSGIVNLVLPEGMKTIPDAAFQGASNLKSVHIPDSVISIGEYAFLGCDSMRSLWLPDSIKEINPVAFSGNDDLYVRVPLRKLLGECSVEELNHLLSSVSCLCVDASLEVPKELLENRAVVEVDSQLGVAYWDEWYLIKLKEDTREELEKRAMGCK